MDHTPSYKNSTLSMMVLYYFISLGVIIIISILIAWLSPETYKLLSQENTLLLIVFGYYVVRGEGLVSAYLQSRKVDPDSKTETEQITASQAFKNKTTGHTGTAGYTILELNPTITAEGSGAGNHDADDLYADKLQAYDPTDK